MRTVQKVVAKSFSKRCPSAQIHDPRHRHEIRTSVSTDHPSERARRFRIRILYQLLWEEGQRTRGESSRRDSLLLASAEPAGSSGRTSREGSFQRIRDLLS